MKINALETQIGYTFKNTTLFEQALTHSSFSRHKDPIKNNERLEFFGDSVLKLVVSEILLNKYKKYSEGELSQLRAYFISDQYLFKLALKLKLGQHMLFSPGEAASGGAKKKNNLANCLEAIIGAIYLDGGLENVHIFVNRFWEIETATLSQVQNAKTVLKEWLQQQKAPQPLYVLEETKGPEHSKEFQIVGQIDYNGATFSASAWGKSKKEAEQKVAESLLDQIKND